MPRRVIAVLGDASLLDYDGAILYRDGTEDRVDFWEILCAMCGGPLGDGCPRCREDWQRYARYDVRSAIVARNVAEDLSWFVDGDHYLGANSALEMDWLAFATSEDVLQRAQAVLAIRDYLGPDELDSYPVRMTRTDLLRHRPFYRGAIKLAREGK